MVLKWFFCALSVKKGQIIEQNATRVDMLQIQDAKAAVQSGVFVLLQQYPKIIIMLTVVPPTFATPPAEHA